jgi:hypothetical protein
VCSLHSIFSDLFLLYLFLKQKAGREFEALPAMFFSPLAGRMEFH